MSTYTVTASRWNDGWELHIEGMGVTQCRTLGSAEHMVRDYLRLEGYDGWEDAAIDLVLDLDGLEDDIANSRNQLARAARLQHEAATNSRRVARALRDRGLSVADTAAALGVSRGRVSQFVRD